MFLNEQMLYLIENTQLKVKLSIEKSQINKKITSNTRHKLLHKDFLKSQKKTLPRHSSLLQNSLPYEFFYLLQPFWISTFIRLILSVHIYKRIQMKKSILKCQKKYQTLKAKRDTSSLKRHFIDLSKPDVSRRNVYMSP